MSWPKRLSSVLTGLGALSACALIMAAGTQAAQDNLPVDVSTLQFGHGIRYTDTLGFTLYRYDNDLKEPGTSTCVADCSTKYPPLISTHVPDTLPSGWSLITREGGEMQWTYRDMPMYRFARDSHKGAAFGEGRGWTIAFDPIITPPSMSIAKTTLGQVLASVDGLTLYTHSSSENAEPFTCRRGCMETWTPLEAPWSAVNFGDFSVQSRPGGVYQWAYKNNPLYIYAADSERGDINGEGIEGVWKAMVLEPAPPNPEWVKVVGSDGGKLFADTEGMTLYTLNVDQNNNPLQALGSNSCDTDCLINGWQSVETNVMLAPVGNWSVLKNDDGTLQWAYLGMPLYTSKDETRPGELIGTTRRAYQPFKPIMYEIPALQGVFN